MTTTFERMRAVLVESGQFTTEQISQLFTHAELGVRIAQSSEDDEEEEEEIDGELMLFIAQTEAFDRATGI
jgi:hypothetical protein